MIVDITTTYHLTIGITDITNTFTNTLKSSYECEIIYFSPHYIYWFKFCFPAIRIKPPPNGCYIMKICRGMQLTKSSGRHCNTIIHL